MKIDASTSDIFNYGLEVAMCVFCSCQIWLYVKRERKKEIEAIYKAKYEELLMVNKELIRQNKRLSDEWNT